jgi:hypothetical protein
MHPQAPVARQQKVVKRILVACVVIIGDSCHGALE